MDNFLDRYKVPKLKQDQINPVNSPITPKETGAVTNILTTKTIPESVGFSVEFYQTFKEDLILVLFKTYHEAETKGALPNLLYEATITLKTKLYKNQTQKKNITAIMDIDSVNNILNKILAKWIQEHIKMMIHLDQVDFISGMHG